MTRILIVEDEEDVAELVADVLSLEGYESRISLGETALRDALEFRPDAVLLDLMMPGVDGFTVSRLLRQDEELHNVPIVVMTAMHEPSVRAAEVGTSFYLAKPFNIGDLLTVVEQAVSGA